MSYYGNETTVEISIGSEYVTIDTRTRHGSYGHNSASLARILRRETEPSGNEIIVLDRRIDSESNPLRDGETLWWRVGEFATELHSQRPAAVKADDGEDQ